MATMRPFPKAVGTKFERDGRALSFPGNTIICPLPREDPLYTALEEMITELRKCKYASLHHILPEKSWHMTVFEGVCDQVREPGRWPSDLSIDSSLEECDRHFIDKLANFKPSQDIKLRMRVHSWRPLDDGVSLRVVPRTAAEEARIRGMRDELSSLFEIRKQDHEKYEFHISISYSLLTPDVEQQQTVVPLLARHIASFPPDFELGWPQFCHFETMKEFVPLLDLPAA